jgi:hypothetical protein
MRKWTYLSAVAVVVLGSIAPTLAVAESLTKASTKDVSMLLDAATGRHSAYQALLIGETHDRVYIEYVTGVHAASSLTNRSKRVVYWLPRSEITEEQWAQFNAYKDSYLKSWRERQASGK